MAEREDLSWALLQSVQAQPSTSTLPGLTGHVQEACELGSSAYPATAVVLTFLTAAQAAALAEWTLRG